ncbi:hypothetical protein E2562_009286 [Oryza meyeriana var. granulata]|uniref:Uncharacterized protein n=1 Tax=Oryza meyeriana var. granulata TaxID=110450 RepID=A0A6G1E8W0_9ORYZ|nr:hypothetical protein E2562_009286 [Oryza meyeriana var. granulata]
MAEHDMTPLYALSSSPTTRPPPLVHVHPALLEIEVAPSLASDASAPAFGSGSTLAAALTHDFGGSFHDHHHLYRLRDGDEFHHCSRHRFVYTRASNGFRLGTVRDGAGQHSRLPKDYYMRGSVPSRDGVCP